ncbi:hypothetical protein IGI04_010953 [Brassica rapa subsp. trilocularis]|uniref:Uncharacterized protein n=1 Tax=Brassica rapa subsp. trilocularis TaxID=1813537 RepID=A0ABQ7N4Z7_BRACM|nr:hypothetical protein IGI04_010953 [Brassica rapa subsp. trilocularis]
MAPTYTLLADLRAGRCSNTAEVHLLRSVYKSVSSCLHEFFQGILSFVHNTVWKVLFGKVYSIREAAANNLRRFAEEFGPEWAMQHLVPQVLDMVTNPHYLHRMMVLRAISLMAPVMGSEITCSKFLPVVAEASKDRVPNVKFNVAKLLQSLIPIVDQSVVEKTIRQCLVDLSEDPDVVDVRYFAN